MNMFSTSNIPWLQTKRDLLRRSLTSEICMMGTPNPTHRLLSSSFLGLPYRVLNINPQKELLTSLWVNPAETDTLNPPET